MSITNQDDDAIAAHVREGERKARELDNRGPIEFGSDGLLDNRILDAYSRYGFYVFEDVVTGEELNDLQTELERMLERVPHTKDALVDAKGRPAIGAEFSHRVFNFAKPLSDPVGGTSKNQGRHHVKMEEPEPPPDAPEYILYTITGPLQIMDSCLRLYGHSQLLSVAEQINGPDFAPFGEAMFIKQPGLGASVAWHQDGTTHWDKPDLNEGTHGFNFMFQFYGSSGGSGVWVLPGSHKGSRHNIKDMIQANDGSDRLPGAVPLVCEAGDVVMANRQTLHCSFANTSPDRRVTFNFGFHRRASVLNVKTHFFEKPVVYDEEYIHERARLIAVAIDARQQRFPHESRYVYQPFIGQEDANRWNEAARENIVKDYHLKDLRL
jgi:hypothetical protein